GRPSRLPSSHQALLAQLVEHLHGKEGVSGSSPEEGFDLARPGIDFIRRRQSLEPATREVPVSTAELDRREAAGCVERRPVALGSFVISAVLTAIGSFSGNDDHAWRQWLIVLVVSAVVT